ncbi:ComEA family DNA-binding protein [Curtobacterium sp. HSID17257]|uniref:ComEA family DNA-binding protein n=1 Tax=Curtobacterium sp. HSID17257 TaxID=2419510 RepID=UPI000F899735|nr:ComEA family DNA-binding protein [Curtobacterium sp. HSID17257]RUQ02449.1 ComEA family DNA-binding protein [Curtobacterium sp. HSID17257]
MTAPSPEPPGAGSWVSRFALSPRAAVALAAVVVALALVVVAIGTLDARSSAGVTVTSGPSTAEARPSRGPGTGASPGPASADAPGVGAPTGSASAAAVSVYVLGAVVRAGVVEVPSGTRVDDVLQQAGGATADADLARLNLARPVVDGERLYVPRVGETAVPEALRPDVPGGSGGGGSSAGGTAGSSGAGGVDPGADVVDLNTADQATLETLPGIGPALAARILAWREEHGGFSSVDDLLEVSGIGDTRLAELRDRVRV